MDVDRVARRWDERCVAGLDQRPHQVDEALLGAHRRDDLGLVIEVDAEAPPVEIRAGQSQLRDALRGGVAVVVGLRRRLLQLGDGHVGRRQVGVAEAEVDDVLTGPSQLEGELTDHGEDVGRQPVEPAEGVRHGVRSSPAVANDSGPWPSLAIVTDDPAGRSTTTAAGASSRSPTRSRVFSPAKPRAVSQSNKPSAAAWLRVHGHHQVGRDRRLGECREPRPEHDPEVPVLRGRERRRAQARGGRDRDHLVRPDQTCQADVRDDGGAGRRR